MDTAPGTLVTFKMYINGQWVESASGQHFESHNPYTGKPWALIPRGNAEDVDRAVRAARKAFTSGAWPKDFGIIPASRRDSMIDTLICWHAPHRCTISAKSVSLTTFCSNLESSPRRSG